MLSESRESKCYKEKKRKNNAFIKCVVCDNKKLKFVKEQQASRLLRTLGIKIPSNKIPSVDPSLF